MSSDQSYPKSKSTGSSKLEGAQAHIKTSTSGPTGSSRSYPKGKGSAHNTDFNPVKDKGSTYGINGV